MPRSVTSSDVFAPTYPPQPFSAMFFESLFQDLRIGARGLIKDKAFTLLAVSVLALGICGVTTQLSVVRGMLWRALPFPEPERLMDLQLRDPKLQNTGFNGGIALPDFLEFAAAQHSFTELAAYLNGSTVNVTIDRKAVRFTGGYVTYNFFSLLGVQPIVGRSFRLEDDQPGAERVTILGHAIWQREFGGARDVIGRTFRMNGRTATIIGVMPAGFKFPNNEELWVPLSNEFPPKLRGDPQAIAPAVFGRLKPGLTIDQAKVEFDAIAKRLAASYPKTNSELTDVQIQPMQRGLIGPQAEKMIHLMLAAVLAVLLIACVNVMNMQLARATLRTKELAIRGALGASGLRIVRQMLTESLVLASIGAVVGVALAFWTIDLLANALQTLAFPPPFWVHFSIDPPVLASVVAVVLATVFLSGFVPAVLAARTNAADMMKESGRGNTSRLVGKVTRLLVIGQIGLTFALLVACTLMIRSIVNQQTVSFGYDTSSVLTARMGLFQADYPTPADRVTFFERVKRELRANPAFEYVALTSRFRMTFNGPTQYEVDDKTFANPKDAPRCNAEQVSDGYFDTLGLKVLEGREFTLADSDARQPVAIINTVLAQKHFGHDSPIGRRIRSVNPETPWRTIVGVVPDTLMQGPFPIPGVTDNSGFFVPLEFQPPAFATIVVRGRAPPSSLTDTLRQQMAKLDPNLPLYFVGTPRALLTETLAQNRILAMLFSIFGLVGVVLSAVGLYGVMSFSVNQRTQEFGIRMALGADGSTILRTVLQQGMGQLAIGVVLGVVTAFALVSVLKGAIANFLFQVNPQDPVIYLGVVSLLALIAMVACLVPARRATQVDPMVALRTD